MHMNTWSHLGISRHRLIGVQMRHRPAGEHVGQHVFGDLGSAYAKGVARVLHLPQALPQRVQFLRHLVGSRVADVGEAVVDFPEEAAELEGRVYVAVAHAAYAHAHQLARQVRDAQQVVGRRYLEGQYARACPCNLTFTLQRKRQRVYTAKNGFWIISFYYN